LRFSRQLLQATMENVTQGISVVDAQLRVVAWNRRYLELFGYPDGLVTVGRPVVELLRWSAAGGAWTGRPRSAGRKAAGALACRHSLHFPTTTPQRTGVQHSRSTHGGRRLRHDLYGYHGLQAP
jgi:PAS domain-containing protein